MAMANKLQALKMKHKMQELQKEPKLYNEPNVPKARTSISTYIFTLIAFVLFFAYQMVRGVIISDEPWLFTAALNISNGLIQHRDFSVVVPPLYYTVFAIPLIFCKNILVFRATTAVIQALIVFFTLKVFEVFKIHPVNRMFYTLATVYMISALGMVEYNVFSEMLLIIGVYVCVNRCLKKQDLWIALVICAMILTKHTTGTIMSFALFLAYLVANRPGKNRVLYVIKVCFIVAGIFIAYLLVTGSFMPFFDQCVFNISSFTHRSPIDRLIASDPVKSYIYIAITLFALSGTLMVSIFQKNETTLALFFVNLSNIIVIYPICNMFHTDLILFMDIISIAYLFHIRNINIMKLKFKNQKIYIIIFGIAIYMVGFVLTQSIVNSYNNTVQIDNGSQYYQGARIDRYYQNKYDDVIAHIKECGYNRYYIIEDCGQFISLNCDIVEKGYMVQFLDGNIGTADPIQVVIDLSKGENTYIGIYNNDDDVFWQTSKNARQYVKDNFTYATTVGCIDFYCNQS